jgi:hypothetical protein
VPERAGGGRSPLECFERSLYAYLDAIATHPTLARLFLVEVYAAGPEALHRRAQLQRRFLVVLDRTFRARTPTDHLTNGALVAAIRALVTTRVADGDDDAIRDLHRPVTELVRRLH